LPEIDENGSTKVEGNIEISYDHKSESVEEIFRGEGIEVSAFKYIIDSFGNVNRIDSSRMVDGGLNERTITTKNNVNVNLLGPRETLNKIEKGDELVILNKERWKSNSPFAILVSRKKGIIHHRKGLIELGEGEKNLTGAKEQKIIIGFDNQESKSQYQFAIEVPPKGNN